MANGPARIKPHNGSGARLGLEDGRLPSERGVSGRLGTVERRRGRPTSAEAVNTWHRHAVRIWRAGARVVGLRRTVIQQPFTRARKRRAMSREARSIRNARSYNACSCTYAERAMPH